MKLKAEKDAFLTAKREAIALHKEKLAVSQPLFPRAQELKRPTNAESKVAVC